MAILANLVVGGVSAVVLNAVWAPAAPSTPNTHVSILLAGAVAGVVGGLIAPESGWIGPVAAAAIASAVTKGEGAVDNGRRTPHAANRTH